LNQLSKISEFGSYLQALVLKQTNNAEGELLFTEIQKARHYNHWFTDDFVIKRLISIAGFLSGEEISENFNLWTQLTVIPKCIGVSSEEHIPLEEFPALLAILVSGNSFQYKTTDKSDKILPLVFEMLVKQIPEFENKAKFSHELLKNVDSLYFSQRYKGNGTTNQYLKIKKSLLDNRPQSIAILEENTSNEEIALLGNDIFNFYGQGAGNVRKIYIPQGFDLRRIFENIEINYSVMEHSPYANNYQYHQSVYLMNRITHLDNGFLLFKEDSELRAPTGVMYYHYYENYHSLYKELSVNENVSNIYIHLPKSKKDRAFGDSINQLLLPSPELIAFLK
jgi:hypothetical protein